MEKVREYWLDGFNGPCKSGAMYRSRIHLDLGEFEDRFNRKVVGIKLETDYESNKPSWTVEFYTEVTEEDAREIVKESKEETDSIELDSESNGYNK